MSDYARPLVQKLNAYMPGEQPRALAKVAKLNTNESPYPPAPEVFEALATLQGDALRRYPSPTSASFRAVAAELHGVTENQVLATNGGDELLRMLMTAYAEPGAQGDPSGVGLTDPTYSLYEVLAHTHGTPITVVHRQQDYSLPEDLAARWNEADCSLAFVVNPHAPTGLLESAESLRRLAQAFNGVLVIDEAYVDYAAWSCIDLVRGESALPNVVLLRSLSKGYALAGLRFGYALASEELIEDLNKVRDSYNCDAPAQAAAVAALKAQSYYHELWHKVKSERESLTEALRERNWGVLESHTNFILTAPPNPGIEAMDLYAGLKSGGVLVRWFNLPGLEDKLRISVGTPDENALLLQLLDEIVSGSSDVFDQPFTP